MKQSEKDKLSVRIKRIRELCRLEGNSCFEAATLARTVLFETVGNSHPLMLDLDRALEKSHWILASAASKGVLALYDEDGLTSPRLGIAHEIEGDILDLALTQVKAGETEKQIAKKQTYFAISAFLAGAVIEDALRRLCESNTINYDTQHTSISKLQSVLYQPAKQIEIISSSENKQITAWGDTRNKADHGRFEEITYAEVLSMVISVRSFIDKHLP